MSIVNGPFPRGFGGFNAGSFVVERVFGGESNCNEESFRSILFSSEAKYEFSFG